jgi:omega-6 fatty acid desaturase (delta-12 desaturase)
MNKIIEQELAGEKALQARDWVQILARYRTPSLTRSIFELVVTLVPFTALWALAWVCLSYSHWLAFALSIFNSLFIVRLFAIQHDCGHASFFKNRKVSDWVGRALGILTVTPYDVWRRTHSQHHSVSGHLERQGMGDIHTKTVAEYQALNKRQKFFYRLYRHPFVLFALGPTYLFIFQNRLPLGLMTAGAKYWTSAMGTNAAIFAILGTIYYFGGWAPVVLIFLPSTILAATLGVWLFYVQHQFEETNWDRDEEWDVHESALSGSSHYDLPIVLQWFSANIGIHHVHHLYSRIPFYRLPQIIKDHPSLSENQRLTIRESLASVKLHLWDEAERRLISYKEMHARYGRS